MEREQCYTVSQHSVISPSKDLFVTCRCSTGWWRFPQTHGCSSQEYIYLWCFSASPSCGKLFALYLSYAPALKNVFAWLGCTTWSWNHNRCSLWMLLGIFILEKWLKIVVHSYLIKYKYLIKVSTVYCLPTRGHLQLYSHLCNALH